MEDIKYAYQIHPKKPIRALPEFGLIRTKRTLMLTKEQVLKVLPFASVYRRFNHDTVIRTTVSNLDRLHNASLMSEEEYKIFTTHNTVFVQPEDVLVEEPKVEAEVVEIPQEPSEVVEDDSQSIPAETEENIVFATEEVQEDTISGTITEESTESEESDAETQIDEAVEETVVVESDEEVEDNSEEEKEEVEKTSSKTSVNYNGKKKHHNH